MRSDATLLQCLRRVFRVRCGGEKVAAHAEEELNFSLVHLLDCLDRVGATFARRRELKFASEFIGKRITHPFPNSHRPIALNVGMTAHWTRSGAPASDVSTEEEKIHYFLNGRDGVLVLRQTHRPATNDAFTTHRDFRRFANLLARQSARFENLIPRRRANVRSEFFEPDRELLDELSI